MKPLPVLLTLFCLTALAEPRTVTLTINLGGTTVGPIKKEDILDVPANHAAVAVSHFGTSSLLTMAKDGITFTDLHLENFAIAGPCKLRLGPLPGASELSGTHFVTFRLEPETFDVTKALVLGPTTNTVVVSHQSSSNLVDWSTVTNQVFSGIPSAQFFRVIAQTAP